MNEADHPAITPSGQRTPDAPDKRSRLLRAILGGGALWLVMIGGTAALFTYAQIRNDRRRTTLALHGLRTGGTILNERDARGTPYWRNCGRGLHAIVRFQAAGKTARSRCVSAEDLPPDYTGYVFRDGLAPSAVGVIYDSHDASKFVVTTADGLVPLHGQSGIWRQWFKRTALLFALYFTVTTIVLVCRHRRR